MIERANLPSQRNRFPGDTACAEDAHEEPRPSDWSELLLKDVHGKARKDSLQNAILFLENRYKDIFVLNEFSDEVFVVRCPPWEDLQNFKVHRLSHNDVIRMTARLECDGLALSIQKTENAILTVAKKSARHPVREYFNSLKWDGTPRLQKWLSYYLGSEQNYDYLAAIGTMWMVAAVKRIFNPGAKFDHMLVLEGKTGAGKSGALRALATFGQDEPIDYFCDSIRLDEVNDPSAIATFQGKIIIEFQELDGMKKKDDAALKRFITLQRDEIQKKYENQITSYPRQFVLAGTTNEDTWLRDPTGNRRYWPVKVGDKIDIEALKNDREQLWAEAVVLHRADYKIWISDDDPVYLLAQTEQAQRITADIWETPVLKIAEDRSFVTLSDILKELNPDVARHDNISASRIAGILRNNGWENGFGIRDGKRGRVWKKRDH